MSKYKAELIDLSNSIVQLVNDIQDENVDKNYDPYDAWYDVLRELFTRVSEDWGDTYFNQSLLDIVKHYKKELNS